MTKLCRMSYFVSVICVIITLATARSGPSSSDYTCPKDCSTDDMTSGVSCVASDCTQFPTGSLTIEDVKSIDLSYNRIQYLPDLKYPTLDFLDLSGNAIVGFNGSTFRGCQNLKYLNLSSNVLGYLSDSMFSLHMNNLELLNVSNNKIKAIEADTFQFLSALKSLNLSYNRLETISNYALSYQRNLEQLHMEGNKLSEVRVEFFQGLRGLQYLSLRNNRIKTIDKGAFVDLNSMMRLDLGENMLTEIRDNAFTEGRIHSLSKLQAIHLDNNNLKMIHDHAFSPFPELRYIFLDENDINTINNSKPFPASLKEITMARNTNLRYIRNGTFTGMAGLEKVDISGCYKLHKIDIDAFDQENNNVKYFDASQCGLLHLPPKLLNWMELTTLSLSGNPWDCNCDLKWAKDVLPDVILKSMQCATPHRMKGQTLMSIKLDSMSCTLYSRYRHIMGVVIVTLTTILFILSIVLVVYRYRKHFVGLCQKKQSLGTYHTLYNAAEDRTDPSVSIQMKECDTTADTQLLNNPEPVAA